VIIAVDGPAAAGKGTLARRLATHYGLAFLDTGALYRATALHTLLAGRDPADPQAAEAAAHEVRPADIDDPRLREEHVAQAASIVAAIPGVRRALLQFQRDFATRPPGAVLDGRDIGTVVCPGADAKLYVTASVEARARRRAEELRARGDKVDDGEVLIEMRRRDARDASRATAPLALAPDAVLLDTTELDVEGAFAAAVAAVEERLKARAST
jgi:CMP/dCMP kinase